MSVLSSFLTHKNAFRLNTRLQKAAFRVKNCCKDNSFFYFIALIPTFFCNFAANLSNRADIRKGFFLKQRMEIPIVTVNSKL